MTYKKWTLDEKIERLEATIARSTKFRDRLDMQIGRKTCLLSNYINRREKLKQVAVTPEVQS